ncbi:unnamed protein product [Pedinophyceae sp. YPF-701]|nr:unnamed protein product [Pedinophyceae sp. YPF-701]
MQCVSRVPARPTAAAVRGRGRAAPRRQLATPLRALSERDASSALSVDVQERFQAAVEAVRSGRPVIILDDAGREGETDMFFAGLHATPAALRTLRTQAGGEMYVAISRDCAASFGLPLAGAVFRAAAPQFEVLGHLGKSTGDMCQGDCSVGISFDHRTTKTGAPDDQRSYTISRFSQLAAEVAESGASVADAARQLGEEFHSPGHVFWCQEGQDGLAARRGHTELSVALARAAELPAEAMVGCVMLCNDEGDNYGPLPPDAAMAWGAAHGVPFLTGPEIAAVLGFE